MTAGPKPNPSWAATRALLTIAEVGAACGVSTKTVQRWIATEGLSCVRKRGGGAREMQFIRPNDLQDWIDADLHDPRAAQPDNRIVHVRGRRLLDAKRHHRRRST